MEMTTDMLAQEDALAPTVQTPDALLPALPTLSPEKYAAAVYKPFKERLAVAIDSVKSISYDITTTAGMSVATKARALFRDLRVEADKERKARKEPITKIGKLLESGFDAVEERVTPLELLFDADIQAEAARKAEVKRLDAERQANIKTVIDQIRMQPAHAAGKSSAEIRALLEQAAARVIKIDEFAEFTDEAQAAMDVAGRELVAMLGAAQQSELVAAEAEAARIAEVARLAAEQAAADQRRAEEAAENARVAAENQRIAAENAAAAQKLADQQAALELAARQQREQAEAAAKAEEARRAEVARLEQVERDRAAAEAQAKIDAELAKIEAARKALADEQAAAEQRKADALAAEQMAARVLADHAEALLINQEFDDHAAAEVARAVEVAPAPSRPVPAPDLLDADDEQYPSDSEILDVMLAEFGLTAAEAIERLAKFDFAAARADLVAEAA